MSVVLRESVEGLARDFNLVHEPDADI